MTIEIGENLMLVSVGGILAAIIIGAMIADAIETRRIYTHGR